MSPRPGTTPPTVYPACGVGHPTCASCRGSPWLLTLLYTHNKELKASISNRPNLQQTATSCLTAGGGASVLIKSLSFSAVGEEPCEQTRSFRKHSWRHTAAALLQVDTWTSLIIWCNGDVLVSSVEYNRTIKFRIFYFFVAPCKCACSPSTLSQFLILIYSRSIDFPRLEAKQIAPPYKPKLVSSNYHVELFP